MKGVHYSGEARGGFHLLRFPGNHFYFLLVVRGYSCFVLLVTVHEHNIRFCTIRLIQIRGGGMENILVTTLSVVLDINAEVDFVMENFPTSFKICVCRLFSVSS